MMPLSIVADPVTIAAMVGIRLGTPEHRAATGVDADLERRAEAGGHQVAGADNQLAIPICRARPRGRARGSGVFADIVRPDGLAGLGVDAPRAYHPSPESKRPR